MPFVKTTDEAFTMSVRVLQNLPSCSYAVRAEPGA